MKPGDWGQCTRNHIPDAGVNHLCLPGGVGTVWGLHCLILPAQSPWSWDVEGTGGGGCQDQSQGLCSSCWLAAGRPARPFPSGTLVLVRSKTGTLQNRKKGGLQGFYHGANLISKFRLSFQGLCLCISLLIQLFGCNHSNSGFLPLILKYSSWTKHLIKDTFKMKSDKISGEI